MQTIMEVILEESEDIPENLLLTLLTVLGRDKEVNIRFFQFPLSFLISVLFLIKNIEIWGFFLLGGN